MRIVVPMIIMLIGGSALGAGCSTLLWSGMADRALINQKNAIKVIEDWKEVSQKWEAVAHRFEKIANKNLDGWKSCLEIAKSRAPG